MRRLSKDRIISFRPEIIFCGGIILFLLLLNSCLPPRVSLPPPSELESMEGYGSLRIEGEQGNSRLKFSFIFSLPHQARIESFDLLGRSLYFILLNGEDAYFVLPSKRIYWKGEGEEIISKFIGFRLNQQEIINLLRGHWENCDRDVGEKREWVFTRDREGRITKGKRGNFRFEIVEFFPDSRFARLLLFYHTWSRGTVKVFTVEFNRPVKSGAFSTSFLRTYTSKMWTEIERILRGNES